MASFRRMKIVKYGNFTHIQRAKASVSLLPISEENPRLSQIHTGRATSVGLS